MSDGTTLHTMLWINRLVRRSLLTRPPKDGLAVVSVRLQGRQLPRGTIALQSDVSVG